jgi:hypothetical protein
MAHAVELEYFLVLKLTFYYIWNEHTRQRLYARQMCQAIFYFLVMHIKVLLKNSNCKTVDVRYQQIR